MTYLQNSRLAEVMQAASAAGIISSSWSSSARDTLEVGMLRFSVRHEDDGRTNVDGYPNGQQWRVYQVSVQTGDQYHRIAEMSERGYGHLKVLLDGPWIGAIEPALLKIEERIAEVRELNRLLEEAQLREAARASRIAGLKRERQLGELRAAFESGHDPA